MLPICNFTDGSRMAAVMLSIILCEKSNDNVGESDMARKRASQRNSGSFLMVHVCFSDQSMVFPSECIHCFGFFISLSSRLVCFSISPLLFPTARKPSSRRGIAEMPYLPLTPYAPQPQKHRSLLHYVIYYSAKFNNVNLFGRFCKKSTQIFKKICVLLNFLIIYYNTNARSFQSFKSEAHYLHQPLPAMTKSCGRYCSCRSRLNCDILFVIKQP